MYKIKVTEYQWVDETTLGNIPQKTRDIYVDCNFADIQGKLKDFYIEEYPKRYPQIEKVENISGIIIR